MTTHDNTKAKLKAFDAFAPVADALEAIPNLDVPGVARDFAKRVTGLGENAVRHGFETPGCACSGGQG